MAWQKIPKENHPVFLAAVPADDRVQTQKMFGAVAAMANGHMFAGLFADTAVVKLDDEQCSEVLALEGAKPFDPQGRGRPMRGMVLLPRSEFEDPARLRAWLERALA